MQLTLHYCDHCILYIALLSTQFYRAIKGGQSDTTESETIGSGLESLQKHTLAAMQSENEALKVELKKYQNVRFCMYL